MEPRKKKSYGRVGWYASHGGLGGIGSREDFVHEVKVGVDVDVRWTSVSAMESS